MNNLYKYFSIIAIISLFTCCATDIVDATGNIGEFAGGSGTAYDPYLIKTAASMMRMKDYPDAHFALAADIDMEGYPWTPIPMETSFDGNNHTIYNLTINPYVTSDQIGLFSTIGRNVKVCNLTIENCSINMPSKADVGGIAGYADRSTISNCHVKLTKEKSIVGGNHVGGLVGRVYWTTITDCSVLSTTNSIVIIGNSHVGGAIGGEDSGIVSGIEMTNIKVEASIAAYEIAGGIIGRAHPNSRFEHSQLDYAGTITAFQSTTTPRSFGGIAGHSSCMILRACKANVVFALMAKAERVGGIVGEGSGYCELYDCYSQGYIDGSVYSYYKENRYARYAVGLIGYVSTNSTSTTNCYTLFDYPIDPDGWGFDHVNTHSIYDLVTQFESPINIAEIMRANASSEASKYWDFNRTWTWQGTANGKTVTAICPKLKWEK